VKIGYASWNLQAGTLSERLRAVGEAGFEAVSFYLTPQRLEVEGEGEEVVRLVEEHSLAVTCHNYIGEAGNGSRSSQIEQEMRDIVAWHERTGKVKAVCFDPGCSVVEGTEQRVFDLDLTIERVRIAADILSPADIEIGVENWLVNAPLRNFAALHERLADVPARALLDLGHLNITTRQNLNDGLPANDYIEQMPLTIVEVHLHDNDGETDLHQPLGSGNLDLSTMARGL